MILLLIFHVWNDIEDVVYKSEMTFETSNFLENVWFQVMRPYYEVLWVKSQRHCLKTRWTPLWSECIFVSIQSLWVLGNQLPHCYLPILTWPQASYLSIRTGEKNSMYRKVEKKPQGVKSTLCHIKGMDPFWERHAEQDSSLFS